MYWGIAVFCLIFDGEIRSHILMMFMFRTARAAVDQCKDLYVDGPLPNHCIESSYELDQDGDIISSRVEPIVC